MTEIKRLVLNRQLNKGSYFKVVGSTVDGKRVAGRHVMMNTCERSELFGTKSLFVMASGKTLPEPTGEHGLWTDEDLVGVRVTSKFLKVFQKNLRNSLSPYPHVLTLKSEHCTQSHKE